MVYPTLLAVIGDVAHSAWRARSVGVYRLWRDGGFAVGALLSGVLADAYGFRAAIWVVAALTATSGVVIAIRMYETHSPATVAQSPSPTATRGDVTDVPQVGLVLDCRDPDALAPFWADALGDVTLGGVENYVLLVPDGRPGPKLLPQRVAEDKAGKNRMHLDIEVPDIEAVANRLEQQGARRVSTGAQAERGSRWIVMADPEGNEFCVCVCDGGSGGG